MNTTANSMRASETASHAHQAKLLPTLLRRGVLKNNIQTARRLPLSLRLATGAMKQPMTPNGPEAVLPCACRDQDRIMTFTSQLHLERRLAGMVASSNELMAALDAVRLLGPHGGERWRSIWLGWKRAEWQRGLRNRWRFFASPREVVSRSAFETTLCRVRL